LPYSGVSEPGCLPGRPGWPFGQVRPNILTIGSFNIRSGVLAGATGGWLPHRVPIRAGLGFDSPSIHQGQFG